MTMMPFAHIQQDQVAPLDNIMISRLSATQLAAHARHALCQEATLSPKPALVDSRGSGAHNDMDLSMLLASAECLEAYFLAMAEAAFTLPLGGALRRRIGAIGRDAEQAMLQETQGVNTHKGAIWALGLLMAAAVHSHATDELFDNAAHLARLPDTGYNAVYLSHGLQVRRQYGLPGAKEEAQQGFPHVKTLGLPWLFQSRARGDCDDHAQLNALLAIMTSLSDTCVASRAGLDGMAAMQQGASAVLDQGGVASVAGAQKLQALEQTLLSLHASPGGAADLLAATLFVDSLIGYQVNR